MYNIEKCRVYIFYTEIDLQLLGRCFNDARRMICQEISSKAMKRLNLVKFKNKIKFMFIKSPFVFVHQKSTDIKKFIARETKIILRKSKLNSKH